MLSKEEAKVLLGLVDQASWKGVEGARVVLVLASKLSQIIESSEDTDGDNIPTSTESSTDSTE